MSARARVHAMFPLDEAAEAELDTRLDALVAEVLATDGQAYDGELAMLRGLVRTLRVVVRNDGPAEKQRADVRRLLEHHKNDDRDAQMQAGQTTSFFRPGHVYAREHHGQPITFVVRAISTSPDGQRTIAHGWRTDPYSDWEPADSDDMCGWVDVTGEAMP